MGQQNESQFVNAKCPKCRGNGFVHDSTMDHQYGADLSRRCFFCSECKGCKGKGVVQVKQQNEQISTFANNRAQRARVMDCPPCRGRGWAHTSSMEHSTGDPNKRCFFCEECKQCKGKGTVSN